MRGWAYGVGGIVALAGIVWFLQGIGVLPGSFMTGSLLWAGIGVACIFGGGGLLYWAARRGA